MASADIAADQKQDAEITLYWLSQSRSQRIVWLLEELGVPYKLKIFKRGSDMLAPPELKKVHPLGKSPVVGIKLPGGEEQILPESGVIVEYLCEYYGRQFVPKRYKAGMEGKIGGETEEWMRWKYYMHYAEGSLMTILVLGLVVGQIKAAPGAPFFIKPITRAIGSRVESAFLNRNFEAHFGFLEQQLASAPKESSCDNGTGPGPYFCGPNITGPDFLMIFPLEASEARIPLTKEKYPNLVAYIRRIQERPAYKRASQRVKEESGDDHIDQPLM